MQNQLQNSQGQLFKIQDRKEQSQSVIM